MPNSDQFFKTECTQPTTTDMEDHKKMSSYFNQIDTCLPHYPTHSITTTYKLKSATQHLKKTDQPILPILQHLTGELGIVQNTIIIIIKSGAMSRNCVN